MVDPSIIDFASPESPAILSDDSRDRASTSNETKPKEMTPPQANSNQQMDLVMDSINKLMAFFEDIEDTTPTVSERPGIPSIEKDVGSMMTYPPPTWSMLQENEVLKTLQPTLNSDVKKERRKVQVLHHTPRTKAPPIKPTRNLQPPASMPSPPPSLFDRFKEESITDVSPQSKPFVPVRSTDIQEPSSIGRDDTMKSPSEIRAEEEIRSTWDRIRDQRPPERKSKESKSKESK